MKNIVIIGNSAAGVTAAETIRRKDKDSRIVIVSDESVPAYQRHRILEVLEGRAKEKDLVFRDNDFYRKNGLELFLGREVVSLQMVRKKVVFKDRETLDFDELVVATGALVKLPELKGVRKEGVVALAGLRDIKFLQENLPLAHTVLIVGSDETARRLARLVAMRDIDVKIFAPSVEPIIEGVAAASGTPAEPLGPGVAAASGTPLFIGSAGASFLDGTPAEPLGPGVEAIADNPIVEILGEGEARAARLASGKVIGASLVVFTGPREPRVDFLRDTEIEIARGILVDDAMRSNIPYVYAVGDVAQPRDGRVKPGGWDGACREGGSLRLAEPAAA